MKKQRLELYFDPSKSESPAKEVQKLATQINDENPQTLRSTAYDMLLETMEGEGKLFKINKPIKEKKEVPKFLFL